MLRSPDEEMIILFRANKSLSASGHVSAAARQVVDTPCLFPQPSAKMLKNQGIDDLGFFNLLYNPHAPQVPGASGLAYSCNDTSGELRSRRVFVRLSNDKWLYVGRYTFTAAPSLTVAEYKLTSPKVSR